MEEQEIFNPSRVKRKVQDFIFPLHYFRSRINGMQAVPSYFYHQVENEEFEHICKWLKARKFRTMTFGEIINKRTVKGLAVLLTFDDGWSSVWSIAFPLAKRYDIKFTLFVNAMGIEESEECRSTIEDCSDQETLRERDRGPRSMLTWGEIRRMYESGLVDVQSHSLHHGLIFASDRPVDFCTHESRFSVDKVSPLLTHVNNKDLLEWKLPIGTPLFPMRPALASSWRYLENYNAREKCIAFVEQNGGSEFFSIDGWKGALQSVYLNSKGVDGWETESGRQNRYRNDLLSGKQIIEERLHGAKVCAVALPWGAMHQEIPNIARDTGHELCVMAYPFPNQYWNSPVPLYPRLFGDSIWTLIHGPLRGGYGFWKARKRNMIRRVSGAIC